MIVAYPLEMGITSRMATNAVLPATVSIASFDTALNLGDQQNNTCISMQAPGGWILRPNGLRYG